MTNQIKLLTETINQLDLKAVASLETDFRQLQAALQQCLYKLQKLHEQQAAETKSRRIQELRTKTQYQDPDYEYGKSSHHGRGQCYFGNEKEAIELTQLLRSESYYYGHYLRWTGPGVYEIVPSSKLDHDREEIFLATYQKINSEAL